MRKKSRKASTRSKAHAARSRSRASATRKKRPTGAKKQRTTAKKRTAGTKKRATRATTRRQGTAARKRATTRKRTRTTRRTAPRERLATLRTGSQDAQVYADVSTEVLADQVEIDTVVHGEAQPGRNPDLSAGDVDAAWDEADVGDETVGGSAPTPDQDQVDAIGKALGVTYSASEPLHTTEKIEQRDEHRWELDPASAEDYEERVRNETAPRPRPRPRPKPVR